MKNIIDLSRFISAQQRDYDTALAEVKNGKKVSHWMWYIFPQIRGLGRSSTSQYYSIQNLDEAVAFLEDTYLGKNLREICQVLLQLETSNATEVFGKPDDMKLKSSMTLFACACKGHSVFDEVLEKYYGGTYDNRTKKLLNIRL